MTYGEILSIITLVRFEVIEVKSTIRQIREYADDIMPFEVEMDISEAIEKRKSEIIKVDTVQAKGYFTVQAEDIVMYCQFNVDITLPSTRSLKPVVVPLEVSVKERYVTTGQESNPQNYEETLIGLENDYIDLAASAVDSILLNLPTKVIAEDEADGTLPSGKDWVVVTEEDYQRKLEAETDKVDPRFAALKTLLNDQDDSEN